MMQIKNKKSIASTAVVMALCLTALIGGAFLYLRLVNTLLQEETRQSLSAVATQSADVLYEKIDGDFRMLRSIAVMIGAHPDWEPEHIRPLLTEEVRGTSFKRIGLITQSGEALTSDNVRLNLSEREFYKQALNGEEVISKELNDYADGKPIYVYAVPIYQDGRVESVLFAANASETYASTMTVTLYSGESASGIAASNGDVLLRSEQKMEFPVAENLFDRLSSLIGQGNQEVVRMQRDMEQGVSGTIRFEYLGQEYYLSYSPIGVNDWYVLSTVSSDVVDEKSAYLSVLTLIACVIVMLVVAGLSAYILVLQRRTGHRLKQLAYFDQITRGMNWNGFESETRQVLAKGSVGQYVMVSFDIDKFKVFNDQFGREKGNQILARIWNVLKNQLQKDEPFARVSADNFNMVMQDTGDEAIQKRLIELVARFDQANEDAQLHYPLHYSFGIYHISDKKLDISQMSDRASMARKTVKGNHNCMLAFYEQGVRESIIEEKNIENEMEYALAQDEFKVFLQPKYSISRGTLVGAEALVRWLHPVRGMVPPNEFIPLFEKNGFITKLDEFVFRRVCELQRGWIDAGRSPVPISVNLSRVSLNTPNLAQRVCATAGHYRIPRGLLELELTESAAMQFESVSQLVTLMVHLQENGFRLSMDDFGTGFSSLNLLRELPVDVLKLDREFFGRGSAEERGRTVIADVVAMANHLNITVVAEGVESKDQVNFLSSIGCDIVQGYYYAKPMPVEEYEVLWLRDGEKCTN